MAIFPSGAMRYVWRAENFWPAKVVIDSYAEETLPSGSDSRVKCSPSLAQKSLWDWAVSTLTPRMTALAFVYCSRSRWKLWASSVQPPVKSFG